MSKKRIEGYIPKAISLLADKYPKGKIGSEYNGYISAFGASIIQSGLKPTLALYENDTAQSKSDKAELTDIILALLDEKSSEKSLLSYVIKSGDGQIEEKVKDVAVAVKLAIRTFDLKRGEGDE